MSSIFTDVSPLSPGSVQPGIDDAQALAMLEAIPEMAWTATPDGRIDHYNERWTEYTGLAASRAEGSGWDRVLHPDDAAAWRQAWAAAFASGIALRAEYRFKKAADGSFRWQLVRANPVRDPSGEVVKWMGMCTDIEDQKAADVRFEEELAKRTAELAARNQALLVEISDSRRAAEAQRRDAERLNDIIATQCQLASAELDLEAFLDLVVHRTDALTGATGSSVELVDENDTVYRACSGFAAAHVGLRVDMRTSFSGLCVREGQILMCDDTDNDARVDRESSRLLRARSVVVAPLFHQGRTIGLLTAMSETPRAFGPRDVQTVQLMAGLVGSAIAHQSAFEAKQATLEDLRAALVALQENENRTRTMIESTFDAFIAFGIDGVISEWNPQASAMFGWSHDEAFGKRIVELVVGEGEADAMALLMQGGEGVPASRRVEMIGVRKDGSQFPVEAAVNHIEEGEQAEICAFLRDITERKREEAALRQMAEYDALTGLPNRRLLHDRLAQAIERAKRSKTLMAFIYLDLDRFKKINDTLGHGIGDALLQQVSSRLTASVRAVDTVARLGGDEFAMVLEDLSDPDDWDTVTEKVMQNIRKPMLLDGNLIIVTASLGGAFYQEHMTEEELIDCADKALYRSKEAGRNTASCFNAQALAPARS